MADELNPEQRAAVEHPGSLVLSAGAGSGKTRVLVARYLRHLAAGVPVKALVAITFTEKAAREMRQRIRAQVREQLLAAEPGSAEHSLWHSASLDLETAAIDTIHGFSSRLLRRFAKVAGLDPAFEVLDETASRIRCRDAAAEAMRSLVLEQSPVGDDLREVIVLYGWSSTLDAMDKMLNSPDTAAWRAFAARPAQQIATDWAAVGRDFMAEYCTSLIEASPEITDLQRVQPINNDGRQTLGRVLQMLELLKTDPGACNVDELHDLARVSNRSQGLKAYGEEQYEAVKAGFSELRKVVEKIEANNFANPPENLHEAAKVALRFARAALRIEAEYARVKHEQHTLDFHDLLVRARNLLHDHESAQAAVQSEIQFLLLDELQDTDPVQMELAELVLGPRWLGGGLFAVGDVKQSIYRFRNAEVALFETLRAGMPESDRKTLVKNYRSVPGLLRFVNALSAAWFPAEALLEATQAEAPPPVVEFHWASDSEGSIEDLRRAEAEWIAKRIQELTTGPGACQPSDIVLLFRALSDVSLYETELQKAGIDYYLVGGRAFYAQQEVFDLHNVLAAVENPNDSLSLAGALRAPFFSLSDDAIAMLASHEDGLWVGLQSEPPHVPAEELEQARRARRGFSEWRAIKNSIPIARLVQRILADTGYDAALMFERLGDRKLANLWKLQDFARDFDTRHDSLADFTAHLSQLVNTQPREEQAATVPEEAEHVVRIMSIHQAKGLEFPVVFVPDLIRESRGGLPSVACWHRTLGVLPTIPWDSEEVDVGYPDWPWRLGKELERIANEKELLRVLYVACTRAEKRLILTSGVTISHGELKFTGPGLKALALAYDLESGRPLSGTGEPAIVSTNS